MPVVCAGVVKGYVLDERRRSKSLSHPFQLKQQGGVEYYERREGFNIMPWLKSPMVLMIGFFSIMMFIMSRVSGDLGTTLNRCVAQLGQAGVALLTL